MQADAVNPGKAVCMDLSHAAASDDGYPKGGKHCLLLVKWGISRTPALKRQGGKIRKNPERESRRHPTPAAGAGGATA